MNVRRLSARIVARRIARERAPKRRYVLINRPANWLTPQEVFAAADELLGDSEPPSNKQVARRLGRACTNNTVRKVMKGYWRDVYDRLQTAGLIRKRNT